MEFTLMQDSVTVGFVLCDAENTALVFTAVCEHTLDGIWRAYLTDGERDCLIGVMIPDGQGKFFARKRYFKTEFERLGLRAEHCKGVLRFGRSITRAQLQWVACRAPGRLFRDPALQSAMKQAHGVLVDDEGVPTRVAVPLKAGCACAPALCLAHFMEYHGEAYAVLRIDRYGNPERFSEQTEKHSV